MTTARAFRGYRFPAALHRRRPAQAALAGLGTAARAKEPSGWWCGQAFDPAVGEHALEVTVADRELQVPAHRPEDHLSPSPRRRRPASAARSQSSETRVRVSCPGSDKLQA